MDPLQRCGASFRAVRIKRRWRQSDLAARAGVSRSLISSIERGHLEHVAIGTLLVVARALEIQVSLTTRWHAGDLDRLVSGRHSRMHEAVARWFGSTLPEWILAPEVSFSIFGERGVIDILAWHPRYRAVLVIELKTDLADVNDLVGTMDRRRRLAWDIARNRGWDPLTVSTWVVVAASRTNRSRAAAHRTVLRNAFAADGRALSGWLRRPDRSIDALSMWERGTDGSASTDLAARHRVRLAQPAGVGPRRARRSGGGGTRPAEPTGDTNPRAAGPAGDPAPRAAGSAGDPAPRPPRALNNVDQDDRMTTP
jgi:transcriptional regulator with XRE-family HTH domain